MVRDPPSTSDTSYAWCLSSDGGLLNNYCSYTVGSRPAFLIPSDFAVEDDSNPLEGYSNRELIEELFRRVDK